MLDLGLDLDVWPWVWLGIAVIFAIVELTLLGGQFILLPFAASAFVAAIAGFYDVAVEIQWTIFLLGGAVLFVMLYRWARRFIDDNALPPGVGADRLVGMVGIVTATIDVDDTSRRGRVSIDGEVWGAIADVEHPIAVGSKVRITAMQGTRVVVEPATAADHGSGEEPT